MFGCLQPAPSQDGDDPNTALSKNATLQYGPTDAQGRPVFTSQSRPILLQASTLEYDSTPAASAPSHSLYRTLTPSRGPDISARERPQRSSIRSASLGQTDAAYPSGPLKVHPPPYTATDGNLGFHDYVGSESATTRFRRGSKDARFSDTPQRLVQAQHPVTKHASLQKKHSMRVDGAHIDRPLTNERWALPPLSDFLSTAPLRQGVGRQRDAGPATDGLKFGSYKVEGKSMDGHQVEVMKDRLQQHTRDWTSRMGGVEGMIGHTTDRETARQMTGTATPVSLSPQSTFSKAGLVGQYSMLLRWKTWWLTRP
jgi:hypothetical protein